ncbi:hypothetical protein [Corynebacterium sp. NML140438]|uniref:hypothetical protein n=1 Tax=Corynebacterium sp. NML140438 TaxID=1906334 RepID=UPI001160779D|nr:hypothetical protein [Corynebacterium sp. NML140438]
MTTLRAKLALFLGSLERTTKKVFMVSLRPSRTLIATVLATSLVGGLTGCADDSDSPVKFVNGESRGSIVKIGIDSSEPEQVVLGEIYYEIIKAMGHSAGVVPLNDVYDRNAAELLQEEDVDLVVACSGDLLGSLDPHGAKALESDIAHDRLEGEDPSEATFDRLAGALPGNIQTVDPSPAQGCASKVELAHLPNSIIPLFHKSKFARKEVRRINAMTRVISTTQLEEMSEEVAQGKQPRFVTADWLREYASINIENPDANGGEAEPTTAP